VLAPDTAARFWSRSGLLTATRRGEWIELDFPARQAEPIAPPPGLSEAMGCAPTWVGRSREDYLLLVADEAAVRALRPDFGKLRVLGTRGVIVTAPSADKRFDFVSRFFAPGVGVDEDPVTGSAHCTLGPFWNERLGRTELVGRQISARGGVVKTRVAGKRVILGGQAVTVARGELMA
jgi:predicted PhzF superfamily epimerase YddE/YHI9